MCDLLSQTDNKQIGHWLDFISTTAYIEELSSVIGIPITEILTSQHLATPLIERLPLDILSS